VGKLVSEIGHIEMVNELQTTGPIRLHRTLDVPFTLDIQWKLSSNQLQGLAGYPVTGLAGLQSPDSGSPDEAAHKSARKIDGCIRTAWERVEDLHRAFEPWGQKKTKEQVEEILRKHESQISVLERIKLQADGIGDIDWRISLRRRHPQVDATAPWDIVQRAQTLRTSPHKQHIQFTLDLHSYHSAIGIPNSANSGFVRAEPQAP
jgi:hypothetical protein